MPSVLTKTGVVYTRTGGVLILCGACIHSPFHKPCPLCKEHLQRQYLDPLVPGSQGSLCCDSEQPLVFIHPTPCQYLLWKNLLANWHFCQRSGLHRACSPDCGIPLNKSFASYKHGYRRPFSAVCYFLLFVSLLLSLSIPFSCYSYGNMPNLTPPKP